MLNHGGQLAIAQQQYPEVKEWLDLSTGISPWSWPVPEVPAAVWSRLPDDDQALCLAAANYYGCHPEHITPVAGSQVAIEWLPEYFDESRIAIPRWGYGEHAHCWLRRGHQVVYYDSAEQVNTLIALKQIDHVLVINPNNPSTETIDSVQLLQWQRRLAVIGGYLIVDQAFADLDGFQSATSLYDFVNVISLRSVGKFYGMAGLRLGFVIASPRILHSMSSHAPLWSVSNVAIFLGEKMLMDEHWQLQQKQRVIYFRSLLADLLANQFGMARLYIGPLFISIFGPPEKLENIQESLAQKGVWVRYFEPVRGKSCLRFGLTDELGLKRLRSAFDKLTAFQGTSYDQT